MRDLFRNDVAIPEELRSLLDAARSDLAELREEARSYLGEVAPPSPDEAFVEQLSLQIRQEQWSP